MSRARPRPRCAGTVTGSWHGGARRAGVLPRAPSQASRSSVLIGSMTTSAPPCSGASTSRARQREGSPPGRRAVALLGDPRPPRGGTPSGSKCSWRRRAARSRPSKPTPIRAPGSLPSCSATMPAASALHERSLELHRQVGDPDGIALAANNLANAAVLSGDYATARRLYERSSLWARDHGDPRVLGFSDRQHGGGGRRWTASRSLRARITTRALPSFGGQTTDGARPLRWIAGESCSGARATMRRRARS